MTEQTRIEAAAPAVNADLQRREGAPAIAPPGLDYPAGEHPETARHRIQREFILAISALSREAIDRKYAYLSRLMDRAKEELGHARSASNEVRRAALQQHVDELVAYLAGHGISAKPPNRNGAALTTSLSSFYVVEEVPAFLGELSFLIDLWYERELAKVHDELLKLTGLAVRLR